jgi:glycerol-3-phosphate acyltransferase PlsY
MTAEAILVTIAAYLLGSVPAAYLVAKWSRGIDLRQFGSGNIGGSNLIKAASVKLAIPVFIYDFLKGAVPVWIAQLLGLSPAIQITAGIFAIIGHNWPVFLRFQGGRGIFTSLAVITAISPLLGFIILVIAYSLAPFKQLSVGVFLALTSLPFLSWFASEPLGIEERLPITVGFIILTGIGFIRRLWVPRTPLSQSVHPLRLFINRLFLDRDITNRKAWISQTRAPRQDSQKTGSSG